jgi:hypothetical protein
MADLPTRLSDEEANHFEYQYQEFRSYLKSNGFVPIGMGSFRQTYRRDRIVVKVPRGLDGISDNIAEAISWKKYRDRPTPYEQYLAPCRLLANKALMMVHVDTDIPYYNKPEWCRKIDSAQVGKYKGRIVAFDYGLEVPERFCLEELWGNQPESFFIRNWTNHHPRLPKK